MEKKGLIIIGGGQSALACGYYLRRTDAQYIMLDAAPRCFQSAGFELLAVNRLISRSRKSLISLTGWDVPSSARQLRFKAPSENQKTTLKE